MLIISRSFTAFPSRWYLSVINSMPELVMISVLCQRKVTLFSLKLVPPPRVTGPCVRWISQDKGGTHQAWKLHLQITEQGPCVGVFGALEDIDATSRLWRHPGRQSPSAVTIRIKDLQMWLCCAGSCSYEVYNSGKTKRNMILGPSTLYSSLYLHQSGHQSIIFVCNYIWDDCWYWVYVRTRSGKL